jgi:hypothetical protein
MREVKKNKLDNELVEGQMSKWLELTQSPDWVLSKYTTFTSSKSYDRNELIYSKLVRMVLYNIMYKTCYRGNVKWGQYSTYEDLLLAKM